jgi:CDP-glucose 4,6-dehydratase
MMNSFWKEKKVLITGHTGFKGSWLSLWLQKLGAEVIGYSLNPPSTPAMFELACVDQNMISVEGDVTDYRNLFEVIHKYEPEIIFHMAAQSLVRKSYQEPINTFATNVMGTVHLLEASRYTNSVRVIVNVTSDKCYENKESLWGYREVDPMGGYDPYSSSKGCSELITTAFRHSYFNKNSFERRNISLASARAGNVIGGGDWAEDRIVPDVIRSLIKSEPIHIRNPSAIRPWQHVLEPLHGYLSLAEKLWINEEDYCEGWNFGPSDHHAVTVQELTNTLINSWGEKNKLIVNKDSKKYEAKYLRLDCSKALQKLNWKPKLTFDEMVKLTIEWYRSNAVNKDMRRITLNQIEYFEKLPS